MEKIAEFSNRLLEALSGSMTATQLAEKLGMSKQTISAYTTGTRSPKRPVVYVMAEILHVNPLWLLDYDVSKYDIPPKRGGIKNPPADCNRQGAMFHHAISSKFSSQYSFQNSLTCSVRSSTTSMKSSLSLDSKSYTFSQKISVAMSRSPSYS